MTHQELRQIFESFWQAKDHKLVPPAPLVLQGDPTTLFTSSGMQPLVPFLSGESHPSGKKLYNIQPCFRAVDIDEVGDNRHTTFFEMMGNWSLGDYFKEEQIPWMWEFYTKEISLPVEKLYVTVFEGGAGVPCDNETAEIWKKIGVKDDRIHFYGADKNWWSRAGRPDIMPEGEIGGPDTEVFYEFTDIPHDKKFGDKCHPNCDCGRFLEIGNSVFIEYIKGENGSLKTLPQKNVDYGGGLERLLMAVNNQPDINQIDLFASIIKGIEELTGKKYDQKDKKEMGIIADHLKGATMMLSEGVIPSNKMQGYMVRRLLRRVAVKLYDLEGITKWEDVAAISNIILGLYDGIIVGKNKASPIVSTQINTELARFTKTLDYGIKEFKKQEKIDEKIAFNLFQSYGFPFEITEELAAKKGIVLDKQKFDVENKKHQELSRSTAGGTFKGGLADHSEQVIKYHTATHLLHQALRDVLGSSVRQEGSNITGERLRFDFLYDRKPTEEEVKKIEAIINEKIKESLPVERKIMKREEAKKIGAMSFFKEKYGDEVSVYFVGEYSKEFCGGPHVANTSEIGSIKITKFEKIGANLLRVYAE